MIVSGARLLARGDVERQLPTIPRLATPRQCRIAAELRRQRAALGERVQGLEAPLPVPLPSVQPSRALRLELAHVVIVPGMLVAIPAHQALQRISQGDDERVETAGRRLAEPAPAPHVRLAGIRSAQGGRGPVHVGLGAVELGASLVGDLAGHGGSGSLTDVDQAVSAGQGCGVGGGIEGVEGIVLENNFVFVFDQAMVHALHL